VIPVNGKNLNLDTILAIGFNAAIGDTYTTANDTPTENRIALPHNINELAMCVANPELNSCIKPLPTWSMLGNRCVVPTLLEIIQGTMTINTQMKYITALVVEFGL